MFAPDSSVTTPRVLLCHKQKTSARLHFLRFAYGMLAFAPLPEGTCVHTGATPATVRYHPSAWTHHVETYLGLALHTLEAEPEFHVEASCEAGAITILMACFTCIDLPRDTAVRLGAQWIPITGSRGLPEAELEILRLAYEHLIG